MLGFQKTVIVLGIFRKISAMVYVVLFLNYGPSGQPVVIIRDFYFFTLSRESPHQTATSSLFWTANPSFSDRYDLGM